jgi:hypothetical protein
MIENKGQSFDQSMDRLSFEEKQEMVQYLTDKGGISTDDPIWILIDRLQKREENFDPQVLGKLEALDKKMVALLNLKIVRNSAIVPERLLPIPHWQLFSIISIPLLILIGFVVYSYPQIKFVNSDTGRFLFLCFNDREKAFTDDRSCRTIAESLKISYPPKLKKKKINDFFLSI